MPLLQATNISKRFLGIAALQEVSFTVNAGEVHALLGENGAGKSTLLKILAGAHAQDSGILEFEGQPLGLQTPAERQRYGIVTVYQEFNLMPNMSVAEKRLYRPRAGTRIFRRLESPAAGRNLCYQPPRSSCRSRYSGFRLKCS